MLFIFIVHVPSDFRLLSRNAFKSFHLQNCSWNGVQSQRRFQWSDLVYQDLCDYSVRGFLWREFSIRDIPAVKKEMKSLVLNYFSFHLGIWFSTFWLFERIHPCKDFQAWPQFVPWRNFSMVIYGKFIFLDKHN